MIISRNPAIVYGVWNYYTAGLTCEETVGQLINSLSNFPKRFPECQVTEVAFWWKAFATLDGTAEEIFKITDPDRPYEPMETIEAFQSMKAFVVDEDRVIDKLEFLFGLNAITLEVVSKKIRKSEKVIFNRKNVGCEIVGKTTILSGKSFVDAANEFFKLLCESIKTTVGEFVLKHNHIKVNDEENQLAFIIGAVNVLAELDGSLPVKSLIMTADVPEALNNALVGLKSETLTSLSFNTHQYRVKEFSVVGVHDFASHWNNLADLTTLSIIDLRLTDFAPLSNVNLEIQVATPEELRDYKNNVIQNKSLKRHEIRAANHHTSEEWQEALKPITFIGETEDFLKGVIEAPDGRKIHVEVICDPKITFTFSSDGINESMEF
uniref:FTH domain-containing protein n=1 Tax=Caenorhabditis tropicalis TaxID=1561998 RepID=A0A1I7V229_9PELO